MSRKKTNGKRPGVMIYFDIIGPLKQFSYEQKGRLFEAILDYASEKKHPSFDGLLSLAWEFIRPKIDADEEAYKEVCANRSHSRSGENKAPPASNNDAEDQEDDLYDLPS